ncbi:YDG domain-containing protein [Janthinobacterium sp. RB2P8]|uniref:YDG domain-containing protein n=1 Tax=Janthinobacterium sp. RB2P8 TaxID=3424191 RepID=UPI003F29D16B
MNGHATINRFYRLIWSEKQGAWVAVAENVRGRGKSSGRGAFMAALFAGLGLAPFAWAGPPGANQLPTGGQVVGGAATITQGGSQMTIKQATQRGAIDWQSFNVGSQAQVNFQQPNSGSVTLNRVQDSQASQIFGRITANGQVFLSNPNGVYFGPTSSVNVGGLVATTHTIATADFMAGSNTFARNGATGSVVNDGSLNAALGGYIALLAPQVRNNGIVIAQAGTVAMAAGEQISLQFSDSRTLAGVLVSPSAIAALVENGSAVQAPGGMIIMSAQAANELQGGVVRNTGSVAATGLSSRGGKIVLDSSGLVDNSGSLDASGAGGKVAITGDRMASSGTVRADGGGAISSTLANGLVETTSAVISAQGGGSISIDGGAGKVYTSGSYNADGEQGGKVVITAHDVSLMGAKVSATGVSKGGTILVGGDYQGGNASVRNAATTSVGTGVTLNADATGKGDGGKVVVWSDEKTVFAGDVSARGGAAGGDGGMLEVSGKQTLYFGGTANAHAPKGKSGTLLLDPKDIYISNDLSGQLELPDPHPTVGGSFGTINAALTTTSGSTVTRTGYIVVTNPNDNLGATDSGAAYLFRQSDQALISTLYGTHAGDKVGSNGVTSLTNGNYVVSSNLWNGGMGAVTWGNGTTGWGASAMAVSSSNSLVGSHGTHQSSMNLATSDNVGGAAITVLNNGNYLIGTASWFDNRGALTFGNGSTGVSGVVSAANSLIGSTAMTRVPADGPLSYKDGDLVGNGVTVLENGNYVVANSGWNKGVGAVTFGSGTTGIKGTVGSSNSLVGDVTRFDVSGSGTGTDKVGKYLTVLTGSQFVVYGSDWKNSSGALTSFDGVTPITGLVSASNSLVGSAGDNLSSGGLTLLPSNNAFVISSSSWNDGRGAATWVPFSTDVKTITVAGNGVVGANTGDNVGSRGITMLANNDYVVISPNWSSGKGAATLVDGSTGKAKADQSGDVSASTSLVGAQANDQVGSNGIMELKGNGNYVVLSPYWANGSNAKAGAVTWSSGGTPSVGVVGTGNSLVGTYANDRIGSYQYTSYQENNIAAFLNESSSITLLSNGNYVVASPMFNGTRGAVTWSSGATGATVNGGHTITATNSLLGSNTADFIGGYLVPKDVITSAANATPPTITHYDTIANGVTALSNGNYVTISNYWRNGAALRAGAVSWSDGAGTPTVGMVSASNSLVGSVQDDMVGLAQNNSYGLTLLQSGYDGAGNVTYSGNYVVTSNKWNNGSIVDAGAVTWGSGTAALSGTISDSNSVLGLKTDDVKNWGLTALPVNGNYLIQNQSWDNGAAIGAGALTWIDGSSGRLSDHAAQGNHNIVSGANSLVGSHSGDNVGIYVDYLYNLDATTGLQRFTGNYVALSYNWTNDTKQYAGAVTWGNGATGVKGDITRANSLMGEKENDALGSYYYVALSNGNYVVANPTLDVGGVVNAGAVSWVDGNTGRLNDYAAQGNQNIMSGANALVGSHTNDYVGTGLAPANYYASNSADYANNGYFIISPDWNCGGGAVNYITDASVPLIGVVGAGNAAVGNPNGRFWGGLGYSPNISLTSGGAAAVTFTGDNGHVVLLAPAMPTPGAMMLPGETQFGDAQGATQAMTPDYIAGVLKTGTSVTLQANNDIFVKSAIDATGGVAGGALTMQAGRSITVLGDIITGNRDLNLTANDSLANGVNDAYRDAGIATLSMGVDKQGVAAKIDAGTGNVSLLMADGSDKTNHMAGSISVNSITGATIKLINQGNGAGTVGDLPNLAANCCGFDLGYRGIGADVTLNAGAVLSASGAGTAVTLAAKGNFNNNSGNGAGSIAMSDPAARWLVYANAPGGSTYGALDSQNTAIWNASYNGSGTVQSGNRYLFAYQPTITVGTQNVSKTYGEDLSTGTTLADRVVSLAGAQAAVAGAYLGDTVATALSGIITATSAGAAANAGVAGGPYAITVDLSGATGNNGYAVALGSNTPRTITVAAKALTASLTGVSKVYDASNAATLAAGNYVLSGLVGSESFSITNTSGLFNASDISAGSVSATLAAGDFSAGAATFASNYILPVSATGTGSITAKALSATLTGVSKAYDGDTAAVLNGANYQLVGLVGGQSVSVSQAAGLYNSADVLGANSVSASLSGADFAAGGGTSLANYILPTMATGSASITPKALSASLTGTISKTYDGGSGALLGAGNFSLSGFVGTQSASVTQTAGVYNSVNVATANSVTASLSAGEFTAGSGTTLSNYSLPVSASGGGSIAAKSLSASLTGALGRSYDGTASASLTGGNVALDGVVAGETIHVGTLNGSYDSRNAGTRTVSATLAGGDFTAGSSTLLGNYVLPTSAAGTAVIAPKAITLNAPAISKVYDGTLAYTASAGDLTSLSAALVQGDSVTGASYSYADKNAGNGNKTVNFGAATLSDGNGGANYSVTLVGNGSSTITPRVLNASAIGIDRVYDTSTNAGVTLQDDRIADDVLTLSNTSATFADKNAGSNKVITVDGIAAGGADAGNYSLASTTATTTASITPATLRVTGVSAQDRTYDTSRNAGLSGTAVVTALGNDIVNVTGTGIGQFADKNAGTDKAITVSGYASSDSNYVLLQPTGLSATVTPAVLALSGLDLGVSKTYDGTTNVTITGAPTVSGFGNEVVTVGGVGTGQFLDRNAGSGKAITVSGLTSSDGNYAIGQQAGLTGTITPAQLALSPFSAVTRSYDGSSAAQIDAASYALTGLASGESVHVNKTTGSFDSRNAGNRTVSIGLTGADYTAGANTVLSNYLLPTLATGSGVITPKAIVLNASAISKVYDGTVAYTASAGDLSSLSAALVEGDSVTGASFSYADKNAGNGNKTVNFGAATLSDGNGGANYSVTLVGNGSSTITPRVLNASATGVDRVYDTSTNAGVTLRDDRIAGDVLTLSNTSASFADKNAGSNKVITVKGIAAGGADAGNYSLASTTATTTASITPATLQVTGVSVQQRSYDRSLNALLAGTPTVTALGSDVVSVLGTGSGSYADKNAGTGKAVTVTGYSSSDSNYVLLQPAGLTGSVTPAVLQVSGLSLAAAKTYDGTRNVALSGTATVTGFDGEVVTVGGAGTGQFADKNVGTGKAITLAGYAASDSNYVIGQQPGLAGSITPAPITVTGVRANSKTFDGNATATLNGTAAINVIGEDEVALTGTASASFADATAGTAKPVSVSGYALAGADAGNYALSPPQGLSADIADAAAQVPPPVVVTPPPLPALPLAEQRVAPGLSMPPLGDLPGTGAGTGAGLSSTAPAATPAAGSLTPAAQADTAGISVSLVRPASQQQSGAIAVSVPKQIVDAGNGFGFPLPAQVVEAAAINRVPVRAQLADGSALPSWISYNADSKSFVVKQVPNGALPLEIVLVIGSQRATMVVAER